MVASDVQTKKPERTDADIIAALAMKEAKVDRKERFKQLFPELKRVKIDKKLSVGDIWQEVKSDLGGVTRTTFVKWWNEMEKPKTDA